ncbi:MAG TPA: sulfite exporter TauE/SafE family protein [Ilumatobacteraceae bacterium]|nr:sulfite exporter TauE/SafE family protein [Ilumatobacteraceae bacterium]
MTWWEALLLVGGGLLAGTINAVAGAGSILTVPLLVLAGVPGNDANGSNRVGILTSNAAAVVSFRRLGVRGLRDALPILVPVVVGAIVGSFTIGAITDEGFERFFGFLVFPLVILSLRRPKVRVDARPWSRTATIAVFTAIGLYGGAVQAGIGLVLLAALTRAGYELVLANNIKAVVNLSITVVALPFFIARGEVDWVPALVLAAGFTAGGWVGAHAAVKGGERFLRWAMAGAAVLLAGRLLGLYG